MNKSNHTATIPIRDYEYLNEMNRLHLELLTELRSAMKQTDTDVVIDGGKIKDIYLRWVDKYMKDKIITIA